MELMDLVKVYGPLAIGWVLAAYMGKFILDRYSADIDARVKLATALDALTQLIRDSRARNGGQND